MTIKDVKEKLNELKITYEDNASKPELIKLLKKAEAAIPPSAPGEPPTDGVTPPSDTPPAPPSEGSGLEVPDNAEIKTSGASPSVSAVDVFDQNGYVRSYERERHGPDFIKYAEEFTGQVRKRKIVAPSVTPEDQRK